jgi:DNA-directed RNA polymerase specialized sigma subunit
MSEEHVPDQFKKLTRDVQRLLDENVGKVRNKDLMSEIQRQQVEELMATETQFRESIIRLSPSRSKEVYLRFMAMITVTNRNILTARPYFREQAKDFSKKVTPALENHDHVELQKYHINFNFMQFIRKNWKGALPPESEALYQRAEFVRQKIIENSLPLAISRAVMFDEATPNSEKERMDLINAACIGLISGVDKYKAEKFDKVFRSVCIGRMSGNMVDTYSETSLHFYPSDKKILYKANTTRHRKNCQDLKDLLKVINEDFEAEAKAKRQKYTPITLDQLSSLMNAQSTVSADATKDEDGMNVYSYTASNADVERDVVRRDAYQKMFSACDKLDVIERKIIRLKGVTL